MAPVPSPEELGVEGMFPEGPREQEKSAAAGLRPFSGQTSALRGRQQEERRQALTVMNGILFLAFVFPALFAKLIGAPLGFFHQFVYGMVHEAGHVIWGIFGWGTLGTFGGTLNELLFSVAPAMICLKEKETYPAAFVFLMCAGLSIQHAGWYMESAAHPYGRGFGGVPITAASHDWTNIFSDMGISLSKAFSLGEATAAFGHAVAVIFLATAGLACLAYMYGWELDGVFDAVSPASLAALVYLIVVGASSVELASASVLAIPLAFRLINRAS